MAENEKKLSYNIKGKLISSIAMLLVAVIMVVSSTYAWFTLSTAPEVTNISTAVGANGALEMLLLTKDANGWVYNSGVLPEGQAENATIFNTYWGNLVDLDDYGTDLITLYPSTLNVDADGKINSTIPISIPKYNAGGRVTETQDTGKFGVLNGLAFYPAGTNDYGFRALGVVSGLTDRQQAFRSALGAISTAQSSGLKYARDSLSNNGQTLANIAVKKGMNASATYTQTEVDALGAMITDLEASLTSLEDAYLQAIIAYVLSSVNDDDDDDAILAAGAIRTILNKEDQEIGARLDEAILDAGISTDILPGYNTFDSAVDDLEAAREAYGNIVPNAEYAWGEISTALTALVNVDNVTINNLTVAEVKEDAGKNQIASDILGGVGVTVRIPTNGGIYADVADICEDYTVDVNILSDNLNVGVTGVNIKAKMVADSTADSKFLTALKTAVDNEPAKDESADQPLTEFYGYVIDLAFKTNAASSNLLLQYNAVDRIYADNNNEATMGGGSTMTFNSTAIDFDANQVKGLMSHIRIVFFETDTYKILANAKLDTANAVNGADGVTAYIKIVDETGAFAEQTNAVIIEGLTQNVAHNVSVLVYLDGSNMTNADVAATKTTSMTGSLNLQFASSATLVPMEYADLHTPDTSN